MKRHERYRGLVRTPVNLVRLAMGGRYDFIYDQMPISMRRMTFAKRWNLLCSGLNLIRRRLIPWGFPLHMQFELANYCNLKCPVCPTGTREMTRERHAMDPLLLRKVMEEVGPYLLTASLWGWGESLLHPALGEMLRAVRRYRITTFLSTNGQNLDRDRVIEAIAESPPTVLIAAIDGLTDESNSRFRVGARLAPALEGIRRLAEIKRRTRRRLPILHMRFMVMKHNQHELPEVESFANSAGFDLLTIRTLAAVDSEEARCAFPRLVPDLREFSAYDGKQASGSALDHICMQPFWFPSLFSDGTVVACEQDYNALQSLGQMGNGTSFRDIWHSPEAAGLRKIIRDAPESSAVCRNCPTCGRNTDTSVRAVWLSRALEGVIGEGA